jgi:hypothetical protein
MGIEVDRCTLSFRRLACIDLSSEWGAVARFMSRRCLVTVDMYVHVDRNGLSRTQK